MAAVGVTAAAVVLVADTGEGVRWEEGPWEEDPCSRLKRLTPPMQLSWKSVFHTLKIALT